MKRNGWLVCALIAAVAFTVLARNTATGTGAGAGATGTGQPGIGAPAGSARLDSSDEARTTRVRQNWGHGSSCLTSLVKPP